MIVIPLVVVVIERRSGHPGGRDGSKIGYHTRADLDCCNRWELTSGRDREIEMPLEITRTQDKEMEATEQRKTPCSSVHSGQRNMRDGWRRERGHQQTYWQ